MAKRRTSGIQRRSRASDEALSRRLGEGRRELDWRLLLIGGVLLLGAVVLVVILLFGGKGTNGTSANGVQQVDDGRGHIAEGTSGGPYSSVPASSGKHWPTPADWGVYTTPLPEERVLHNMEHGGIIIFYQPSKLNAAGVAALTTWARQQITTERFKVILTPWAGADFGHPIAVTAWDWLLYLDTPNTDSVRTFLDAHYQKSPEPFGGPGQPAS
jgi:Protein of unknown function (DUF3105)